MEKMMQKQLAADIVMEVLNVLQTDEDIACAIGSNTARDQQLLMERAASAVWSRLNATPKPTTQGFVYGALWRHDKGAVYSFMAEAFAEKVDGKWDYTPRVMYKDALGQTFIRTRRDFEAQFKPVV